MKIKFFLLLSFVVLLSSCVSQKQFTELQALQKSTNDALNSATVELNSCNDEKEAAIARLASLNEQVKFLKANNQDLINNLGNMTTLSQKGAENLERSLESMKEKDVRIKSLRDAVTRKDSVTLALVTSLKGALGDLNDSDIEVNVEKGVVFISISDKSINLKFDSKNLVFIMLEYFKNEFSKSALRNVEFDKFLLVKFT